MKKILFAFISAIFLVGSIMPVSAAPAPTKQELQLKAKLNQIKQKQGSTKLKITRNISSAKVKINQVKKQRAAVKAKRATVKSKAGQ